MARARLLPPSSGGQQDFAPEGMSDFDEKVSSILETIASEHFNSARAEMDRIEELAAKFTDGDERAAGELTDAVFLKLVERGMARLNERIAAVRDTREQVSDFDKRVERVATDRFQRGNAAFNRMFGQGTHPSSEPPSIPPSAH